MTLAFSTTGMLKMKKRANFGFEMLFFTVFSDSKSNECLMPL